MDSCESCLLRLLPPSQSSCRTVPLNRNCTNWTPTLNSLSWTLVFLALGTEPGICTHMTETLSATELHSQPLYPWDRVSGSSCWPWPWDPLSCLSRLGDIVSYSVFHRVSVKTVTSSHPYLPFLSSFPFLALRWAPWFCTGPVIILSWLSNLVLCFHLGRNWTRLLIFHLSPAGCLQHGFLTRGAQFVYWDWCGQDVLWGHWTSAWLFPAFPAGLLLWDGEMALVSHAPYFF